MKRVVVKRYVRTNNSTNNQHGTNGVVVECNHQQADALKRVIMNGLTNMSNRELLKFISIFDVFDDTNTIVNFNFTFNGDDIGISPNRNVRNRGIPIHEHKEKTNADINTKSFDNDTVKNTRRKHTVDELSGIRYIKLNEFMSDFLEMDCQILGI